MAAARKSQAEMAGTTAMPSDVRAPGIEEISRLFPELEVLELVGQGGMGAVYKVRQKSLDRIVALKVFLYRSNDPEFAARFQREARALAKLNHPSIVTVHDFGIRKHTHFLIMEFVDGVNIRQLTAEERLAPEMALQMVPQLCDALQYAHDRGVIHRDIKPENLLLDTNGKISIADFGLAKIAGNSVNGTLTGTQQVMGTLNYMAPEQRERPTEVDHRADIYSLGVVIYEMLTGELPIGRFQPPSSKTQVDMRTDEAVMRALEKEPVRRFQQASHFKMGFNSVVGSVTDRTPAPPQKSVSRPKSTRCMITLMSGREKKGNWRPGDPQIAVTMWGGTCLDLTNVRATDVNLTLLTLMGGVEVIVPHGATVDLDGFILMGATVDNVASDMGTSNMHVRIKSWGAMGGCEVRTPTQRELTALTKTAKHQKYALSEREVTFGDGLVLLYRLFAMLVTIAIPVLFLLGPFKILGGDESRLLGVVTAICAGFIWAGLGYFRILVGARPKNTDGQSSQDYYAATKIGTSVRWFGLFLGFACSVLFVLASFDDQRVFNVGIPEDETRFAAIVCAILCALAFVVAGYVDEFFSDERE
jgi:tRNA A-37 threonylcarbamoyl transferase component Bud32